jgi:hypothetical protein
LHLLPRIGLTLGPEANPRLFKAREILFARSEAGRRALLRRSRQHAGHDNDEGDGHPKEIGRDSDDSLQHPGSLLHRMSQQKCCSRAYRSGLTTLTIMLRARLVVACRYRTDRVALRETARPTVVSQVCAKVKP